jgi:D-alanine-D-alanine ligase
MSARSVIQGLNPEKYEVVPIAITRDGLWLPPAQARQALQSGVADGGSTSLAICPGSASGSLVAASSEHPELARLDIVFPVLHGTYGEDGTIQGMLEMANLPYVGAGVSASAVGMDKAIMKAIWQAHDLPQVKWAPVLRQRIETELDRVVQELLVTIGLPAFVKPANLGSSVGISKAKTAEELRQGLLDAAKFDRKIVVEKGIENPREIELAALGNDTVEVSLPGEIIHAREWYDYKGKYFETDGQVTEIPANLPEATVKLAQDLARRAYQALDMNGLSRVDFLMDAEGQLYLNEVNSMPGFTPISMYGRLWSGSGLSYTDLLDRLIELGLERYHDRQRNLVRPLESVS